MSIITQCPSCGTTFRVTPPQLQAQHGMVRCGRCAQVFDGFKTLATLPDTTAPDAAPSEVKDASTPAAKVAIPAEIVTPLPVEAAQLPAMDTPGGPQDPFIAASRTAVPEPVIEPVVSSFTPNTFEAAAPSRRGGWALGVLLLVVSLAAQGVYFYRSDIAASLPEARPYLGRMCEYLRCTVALPQRWQQISIEASDMRALDPANPGLIALTATLRSNAKVEIGYPALDVVLTNTLDHTLARRIFLPAEYLVPGKDMRGGLAPNAEVTIRLDLDTGDLGAAGFRLALLAAPAR